MAPEHVLEHGSAQHYRSNKPLGQRDWPALCALVESLYPSYKN
jgi:hypothetical protein